jgi:hypothetical protein
MTGIFKTTHWAMVKKISNIKNWCDLRIHVYIQHLEHINKNCIHLLYCVGIL